MKLKGVDLDLCTLGHHLETILAGGFIDIVWLWLGNGYNSYDAIKWNQYSEFAFFHFITVLAIR